MNSYANQVDFYAKSTITKLYLLKLLNLSVKDENFVGKLKELEKVILTSLTSVIRNYANMKQIFGELEHLEFIKDIVHNKHKEKVLVNIIKEIEFELDFEE
jgi:hypothetical protein